MKKGLFIVWTVTPKSRLADVWPDGGLAAAVVDCGSPPQPVKMVDIHNNVARQKCGRIKDFMVGIVCGSPVGEKGQSDRSQFVIMGDSHRTTQPGRLTARMVK